LASALRKRVLGIFRVETGENRADLDKIADLDVPLPDLAALAEAEIRFDPRPDLADQRSEGILGIERHGNRPDRSRRPIPRVVLFLATRQEKGSNKCGRQAKCCAGSGYGKAYFHLRFPRNLPARQIQATHE
jgi:hypothetical protein